MKLADFDGDVSFLAFAADLEFGAVPMYPTTNDLRLAVLAVQSAPDNIAAHWRVEAVKERRFRPGCKMDEATRDAINARTATRIFKRCQQNSHAIGAAQPGSTR